jgi:2-amino-4-hydroxy-6-hydroxymethyldihydropteridine diphosphokinase
MSSEHTVYIGLGSNLGPREETLRQALAELARCKEITVIRVSSFVETQPVGGPPQSAFINAAAELRTAVSPRELLKVLQQLEDQFGRERIVRWGPRTLDLDLLLYEDLIIGEPDLQVPHPLMHHRRFVLGPLCEIAPQARHPLLRKSVRELLDDLVEEEARQRS